MSLPLLLIFAGLVNWLLTLILVEAEITKDLREYVDRRLLSCTHPKRTWAWQKSRYLVGCHLCTGTWVGLLMALFLPPLVSIPVTGSIFTALTVKAIGHLVLVAHKLGEALIQSQESRGKDARNGND